MQRNDQTFRTYMTCFQNESIYIKNAHLVCDACIVYIYRPRYSKTSNVFSPLCIFELKVMFRSHFRGHFLAELNEICCASLLNSILKKYRGIFL